jgi:hypothetical protein
MELSPSDGGRAGERIGLLSQCNRMWQVPAGLADAEIRYVYESPGV